MQLSLEDYFEQFISECQFAKMSRPMTIRSYRQTFSTFIKLIPTITVSTISTFTLLHFFKILQERERIVGKNTIKVGVRKSTIVSYYRKLNAFFNWLETKNIIKKNPLREIKFPKATYNDRKYLRKEEIEKVLAAIHCITPKNILLFKRNLVIFYLLLYCGLRKEELLLLQIRDFDFEKKFLTIRAETSKSARNRLLPLHSSLIAHLKDYISYRKKYTTQYLIVSNNTDNRLSEHGIKQLVKRLQRASGVRFHLHQLRHTFAVNFLKASNNIEKLRLMLGHSDLRMAMVYLRCLPPEEMRPDVENMTIDNFL